MIYGKLRTMSRDLDEVVFIGQVGGKVGCHLKNCFYGNDGRYVINVNEVVYILWHFDYEGLAV
jgi:hypothetical protein